VGRHPPGRVDTMYLYLSLDLDIGFIHTNLYMPNINHRLFEKKKAPIPIDGD